jgi:hypothetical protein
VLTADRAAYRPDRTHKIRRQGVWLFGIEPNSAKAFFISQYAWRMIEHLGYEELAQRYVRPAGSDSRINADRTHRLRREAATAWSTLDRRVSGKSDATDLEESETNTPAAAERIRPRHGAIVIPSGRSGCIGFGRPGCNVGLDHFLWIDDAIEFGFGYKA